MVARCNEQVEAPYEDGVKEARRDQVFDRGAAATAASGS
jgi:hypothetical protein